MSALLRFLRPLAVLVAFGSVVNSVYPADKPCIKITRYPKFSNEGGDPSPIEGTVTGIKDPEKYRVVVYAHTNHWYIQPLATSYETRLSNLSKNKESTWATTTHLGGIYLALLVTNPVQPMQTGGDDPPQNAANVVDWKQVAQ